MKKFIIKIILLSMTTFIIMPCVSCKNDNDNDDINEVTVESIKSMVIDTGYTIIEEIETSESSARNIVGGFVFIFPRENDDINIPVLEFKDNISATIYAEDFNMSGGWATIINDNLLIIVRAEYGILSNNEKIFFENLINGNIIK